MTSTCCAGQQRDQRAVDQLGALEEDLLQLVADACAGRRAETARGEDSRRPRARGSSQPAALGSRHNGAARGDRAVAARETPRARRRKSLLAELLPRLAGARALAREERLVREMVETCLKLLRDGTRLGDVKLLNAALRELRYAFKVFAPYRDVRKVSVLRLGAHAGTDTPPYRTARRVRARASPAAGYMVITGARRRHHARLPGGRRARAELRRQHPPARSSRSRTSSSARTRSS